MHTNIDFNIACHKHGIGRADAGPEVIKSPSAGDSLQQQSRRYTGKYEPESPAISILSLGFGVYYFAFGWRVLHFSCPLRRGIKTDCWSSGGFAPQLWTSLQPSCQIKSFYSLETTSSCVASFAIQTSNQCDWMTPCIQWLIMADNVLFVHHPKLSHECLHCLLCYRSVTRRRVVQCFRLCVSLIFRLTDPAEVHCHLCPSMLLCCAGGVDLLIGGHLGGWWGWHHGRKLQQGLQVWHYIYIYILERSAASTFMQ